MEGAQSIHIGTSGWHYGHWKGPFYPEDLSSREFLDFYRRRFGTTEINNSFYQLPKQRTLEQWRDTVGRNFVFSVKASRYITHMKKLTDPEEPLSTFLKRISTLGETLGPVLFQLPPRWKCNSTRLQDFLKILPADFQYAFEFRDPSWFNSEVYEALTKHKAAFCIYELAGRVSPEEITADFIYLRLHGPGGAYQGQYDMKTLSGWAGAFAAWGRKVKAIYCYFDNDEAGYAAQDALRLQEMIGK